MDSKYAFFLVMGFIIGIFAASAITIIEATAQIQTNEKASPSDTIKEQDIKIYKNGAFIELQDQQDEWLINIDLKDPSWSKFLNTNSMDPLFDTEANTIRVQVACPGSIQVGDILSYENGQDIIIHRVVHKDVDEVGPYFVLKGDNNPTSDVGKVRCKQILGKIVAIIY